VARSSGSRPKGAKPKRPRREIKLPAKYSHAYPVSTGGHNYTLRGVPVPVFERALRRAHGADVSIRTVLIRALELYGAGRLEI